MSSNHLLALWAATRIKPAAVWNELMRRDDLQDS